MMTEKSLKKKILVVDDDQTLRSSLMGFLSRMGYDVVGSAGGKEVLELIATGKADLVISDINMPLGNGIDILERTRKFSEVPFIMMTGLSTISEARRARASGVKYFLAKPFDLVELRKAIANSLATEQKVEPLPQELIQVHLDDFIRGEELDCDAYLRMGRSEFVKVTHGGESLSSEEIARCHLQGIDSLYVLKSDFKNILGLKETFSQPADPGQRTKKHEYFSKVSHCLIHLRSLESLNEDAFFRAQVVLESTLSVLVDHLPLFSLMDKVAQRSPQRLQKSITLALTSLMLARQFTEIGPRGLFELAMASLLHEIGEEGHPLDKAIEAHCLRSVHELQKLAGIPPVIYKLILCHHQEKILTGKDALMLNCLKLGDELTDFPMRSTDIAEHVRIVQDEIWRSKAAAFSPRVLKAMSEIFLAKARLINSGIR